jgi:hypothetical protein
VKLNRELPRCMTPPSVGNAAGDAPVTAEFIAALRA